MGKELYVRLMPVNPRLQRTVANFTYKSQKYRGGERPTWYCVDESLAKQLSEMRQNDADPYSPALFQVVEKEEKEAIERNEHEQYLAQIGALRGTISIPRDVEKPRTQDIRTEKEEQEEKAGDFGGRSAAMAPPRTPTLRETNKAVIAPAAPAAPVAVEDKPIAPAAPPTPTAPPQPPTLSAPPSGAITSAEIPKGTVTRRKKGE